jgi:hypothetical protein
VIVRNRDLHVGTLHAPLGLPDRPKAPGLPAAARFLHERAY